MGREWAEAVSNWFANNGMECSIEESVKALIEQDDYWDSCLFKIKEQINKNKEEGKVIGVVQEIKLRDGSAATLLLAEIVDDGRCTLKWWAIGDSCLVLIRPTMTGDGIQSTTEDPTEVMGAKDSCHIDPHPIKESKEFSNTTDLIYSNSRLNLSLSLSLKHGEFSLLDGDRIYLMTDALSEWFLRSLEKGRIPWEEIERNVEDDVFSDWIDLLRDSKEIKNDDVSLGIIRVIGENDVLRAS